jgi:hypothetical protein
MPQYPHLVLGKHCYQQNYVLRKMLLAICDDVTYNGGITTGEALGTMNNMDIDRAISQRQARIEQLQRYVEELRETERELSVLLEARRIVGLDPGQLNIGQSEQIQRLKRPYSRVGRPKTQRSLATDTLSVLDLTEQEEMSHADIHRELERTRGPTGKRAVWSTLSRLVQEGRIRRPRPARYAAIRKSVIPGSQENGMSSNHHAEQGAQTNDEGESSLSLTDTFAQ